jgi:predicted nuclease of predicted toxin-antitoxin system
MTEEKTSNDRGKDPVSVRILADENIPRTIVIWLRSIEHDVLYAAESRKQTPDADLLAEAEAQGYVVLTEDKDFGELIFRQRKNSHGVILLRMEDRPASARLSRLQQVWTVVKSKLPGHFLVVTASKIRLRPLTPP